MHAALIVDEERLFAEQAMLNRLCIGLMTEGVRVTRIVPDRPLPPDVHAGEQRVALARRMEAPMRVLPWMRRSRSARLMEQFGSAPPDVLYAVGDQAWWLGIDLGQAISRPVLLDVWSTRQIRRALWPGRESPIAGYVACSGALARHLGQRIDAGLVSLVPMGVSLPSKDRERAGSAEQMPSIAVIGRGSDVRAYESLFNGLNLTLRHGLSAQIFLELSGSHEHEIWRLAERSDLLDSVSAIGEASLYRSLLTRCDALVMPEANGELRSILLEAMALGITIIAREDPALDVLVDNQTALLVRSGESEEWSRQLRAALTQPVQAAHLGEGARRLVAAHHRSSEQVSRLIQTLERAQTGGSLKITAGPAKSS